ncbi:unnamed protein product, partial [Mesorhabditis spiculigera]
MAVIEEIVDDEQCDDVEVFLQQAEQIKTQGNAHFGKGEWQEAKEQYQKGIDMINSRFPIDEPETSEPIDEPKVEEEKSAETEEAPQESQTAPEIPPKIAALKATLFSNMAACYIKMEQWEPAVTVATSAINAGPSNEKPLERRAFAYSKMDGKLHASLEDYEVLRKKFPNNRHYAERSTEVRKLLEVENERLKADVINKLKGLGDFCLRPFGLSTDSFELTPNSEGGYSIGMKQAPPRTADDSQ